MKLKPTKKLSIELMEDKSPKNKSKKNTLPSDEYRSMIEPIRFVIREDKDKNGKTFKQYLELNIKRFGDDLENKPSVYIQMYQEAEFYTGYLKGKTVYLPLENLFDLMEELNILSDLADEKGIM